MNRTQKFAINSFSAVVQQVILMIAGVIVPRVILVFYGSEINGLLTSLTQFFSYFTLVEAGLANASVYALYKPLAQKDHRAINELLVATRNFYWKSGFIFVLLTIALAIAYPCLVLTTALPKREISLLVFILGFSGCLDFFALAKYRALLTADQKVYVINIAGMTHQIVNTIVVIIMSNLQVNVVIMRLFALISVALRSIILILYCKKHYEFMDFSAEPNTRALSKRWDALYLDILGAIQKGAPVMIISIVLKDLKLASIYSVYHLVTSGVGGIVGVFTSGLPSAFGEIIISRQDAVLKKAYREFEWSYYTLIGIIYTVTFVMIKPFIVLYTEGITDANYMMPALGFLFVLDGLLYNLKTPQGMMIIAAGHFRETRVQVTIQGMIAVIAGTILACFFGIYGVVMGSVLANLYRDIDLLFYVAKKITKSSWKLSCKHMLCILLTCLGIQMIMGKIHMRIDRYIAWLGWAVAAAGISAGIIICSMGLVDREGMSGVFERFVNLVQKRGNVENKKL